MGVTGLVVSGLLATAMSALASGINSSCSVIATDFVNPIFGPACSEKGGVRRDKMITLLVGFALMAAAYVQKSLTGLRFGRFVSMGLIVGAGYALMTLLFAGMWNAQIDLSSFWSQTFLGAKMGTAMGLGFELIDLIGPRPERKRMPLLIA